MTAIVLALSSDHECSSIEQLRSQHVSASTDVHIIVRRQSVSLESLFITRPPLIYLQRAWNASQWIASDDRVRGGSSRSHLSVERAAANSICVGRFFGNLDTRTLGGAGFASQRTKTETETWDLSKYDGIELIILKGDRKRYTLNLKDALPSQRPDGRDEAGISWEFDFVADADAAGDATGRDIIIDGLACKRLRVPWRSFKATFRGRDKPDATPLKTHNIRRFSIMCRSFFEQQMGDFDLVLQEIGAWADESTHGADDLDEKADHTSVTAEKGWVAGFMRCLGFRSRSVRL